MNMAWIAKGFGVEAEVAQSPEQLKAALERRAQGGRSMASPTHRCPGRAHGRRLGRQALDAAGFERSLLRLNQENVMQMLKEACLWVGLLSSAVMGGVVFGPRLEVGRHVLSKITDPALKAALEEAHAERWGIFGRTLAGNASLAQPYSRVAMIEGWHEFYLLVGTSRPRSPA